MKLSLTLSLFLPFLFILPTKSSSQNTCTPNALSFDPYVQGGQCGVSFVDNTSCGSGVLLADWYFGDGTEALNTLTPYHYYPGPGTYYVRMCVDNSCFGQEVYVPPCTPVSCPKEFFLCVCSDCNRFTGDCVWQFAYYPLDTDPGEEGDVYNNVPFQVRLEVEYFSLLNGNQTFTAVNNTGYFEFTDGLMDDIVFTSYCLSIEVNGCETLTYCDTNDNCCKAAHQTPPEVDIDWLTATNKDIPPLEYRVSYDASSLALLLFPLTSTEWEANKLQFEVFNVNGQPISHELMTDKQLRFRQRLVAGTYFIRVRSGNQVKVQKFLAY